MTQDEIKEVKAVYSAKNKKQLSDSFDVDYVSKPFFSGLIEKLEQKPSLKI